MRTFEPKLELELAFMPQSELEAYLAELNTAGEEAENSAGLQKYDQLQFLGNLFVQASAFCDHDNVQAWRCTRCKWQHYIF